MSTKYNINMNNTGKKNPTNCNNRKPGTCTIFSIIYQRELAKVFVKESIRMSRIYK